MDAKTGELGKKIGVNKTTKFNMETAIKASLETHKWTLDKLAKITHSEKIRS